MPSKSDMWREEVELARENLRQKDYPRWLGRLSLVISSVQGPEHRGELHRLIFESASDIEKCTGTGARTVERQFLALALASLTLTGGPEELRECHFKLGVALGTKAPRKLKLAARHYASAFALYDLNTEGVSALPLLGMMADCYVALHQEQLAREHFLVGLEILEQQLGLGHAESSATLTSAEIDGAPLGFLMRFALSLEGSSAARVEWESRAGKIFRAAASARMPLWRQRFEYDPRHECCVIRKT